MSSGAAVRACMRLYHLTVIVVIALDVQQECWRMSRPRRLPHSIRHTGIEYTFLPEVYMYTTLARTHTHGHETTSLRSVMSGAVARTTESNSAMTFEHSGMPSSGPSTNTGVLMYLRRVQGFYFVLVLASNNRFCTYHNWCNLPFFWLPSLVSAGTCLSQDFRSETYFRNFALYKCVYVNKGSVVNVDANSRSYRAENNPKA